HVHLEHEAGWIKRIADAVNNQGVGRNRRQVRWSKVHVVVVLGENIALRPQSADLVVAAFVPAAHELPFVFASLNRAELSHKCARLRWIIRSTADQNYPPQPRGLPGCNVEQGFGTRACPDGVAAIDPQAVQQRAYVKCALPVGETRSGFGGASVTPQVGGD